MARSQAERDWAYQGSGGGSFLSSDKFLGSKMRENRDGKNAAAVALGRRGGQARAEGLSRKRRKEIARKAAQSRWSK
jgi:hypothetical protein